MLIKKILNKHTKQFVKFSIVGVINTLLNLLVLYILTEFFNVYYMISAVIAFLVAVTNSFLMNKAWTFEEKLKHRVYSKYVKFIVISVFALLVNLAILYILVEYFKVWYIFAQMVGLITNVLINFFGNKFWTFKK